MHEGSEGDKRKECTSAMRDNEERVHKYRKEEGRIHHILDVTSSFFKFFFIIL